MSRLASAPSRLLLAAAALVLAAGCAHRPPPPLYSWNDFPRAQYDALLSPDGPALDRIAAMEEQSAHASSDHVALPPGFRAHLGMLKLSVGDVDRARALWLEEKSVFPESGPYMDQLLKRLDARAGRTAPPALDVKGGQPS